MEKTVPTEQTPRAPARRPAFPRWTRGAGSPRCGGGCGAQRGFLEKLGETVIIKTGLARFGSVQLFFVLSGFVFYYVYKTRISERKMDFQEFSLYRFSRIVPLCWLSTVVTWLIYLVIATDKDGLYPEPLLSDRKIRLGKGVSKVSRRSLCAAFLPS